MLLGWLIRGKWVVPLPQVGPFFGPTEHVPSLAQNTSIQGCLRTKARYLCIDNLLYSLFWLDDRDRLLQYQYRKNL